jgi:hypothetical protein
MKEKTLKNALISNACHRRNVIHLDPFVNCFILSCIDPLLVIIWMRKVITNGTVQNKGA